MIAFYCSHIKFCASSSIDPTKNSLQEINEIEKNNFCQDYHDLHNAIEAIYDIAKENLVDHSTMYDINITSKDILEYIKHLVCDVRQRISKGTCFPEFK